MIGKKAEAVLNRAVRYAVENEHEYFTLEHVLWSLLGEPVIVETIRACGGDPDHLKRELEAYLGTEVPKAAKQEPRASEEKEADPGRYRRASCCYVEYSANDSTSALSGAVLRQG